MPTAWTIAQPLSADLPRRIGSRGTAANPTNVRAYPLPRRPSLDLPMPRNPGAVSAWNFAMRSDDSGVTPTRDAEAFPFLSSSDAESDPDFPDPAWSIPFCA